MGARLAILKRRINPRTVLSKKQSVLDLGAKRHVGLAMDALSCYIERIIKRHVPEEYLKKKTR
jgi:hypothetical protein